MIFTILAQYYKSKMRFARLQRAFSVPAHYRVLDVGSGDSPFAPADVVCEKFPWDDSERTARFKADRPVVVGDVEDLPFVDNSFDFIHCSHVLEHVYHPERAIQELMRVGSEGYIEIPSSFLEKTVNSSAAHLWFVSMQKGELLFTPKTIGVIDPEINRMFESTLIEKDSLYTAFHYARFYTYFNIGFYWKTTIPYRVTQPHPYADANHPGRFEKGAADQTPVLVKKSHRLHLASIPKMIIHARAKNKKQFQVESVYACPVCKKLLAKASDGASYLCTACSCTYPVREGMPLLLKTMAQQNA